MLHFTLLFLLLSVSTYAAAAPTEGGDMMTRALESGAYGLTYAGATVLALRWLGTSLLTAKDAEIERAVKREEHLTRLIESALETNKKTAETLVGLQRTLDRIDNRCEQSRSPT